MRDDGARVRIICGGSYRDEVRAIVAQVQQRLAEGAAPRDIAVLTQMREDMEAIAQGFRASGIPFRADRGRDLFRTSEIKGVMALLEAIEDPFATQAILRTLHFPAWQISQVGRRRLLEFSQQADARLLPAMANGDVAGLQPEDAERAQTLASDLLELQTMALHSDVRDVFHEGMLRTSYPTLGDDGDALSRAQFAVNLSRFYEVIDEYCRFQKSAQLHDTLEYLRLVRETGEEREAPIDQDLDAVHISTIHGAKALSGRTSSWPRRRKGSCRAEIAVTCFRCPRV